jgi:carboxypeptidase Taq
MPRTGAEHRAEQLAMISGMTHEIRTDQRVGEWLGELQAYEKDWPPAATQAVNVREIRRAYEKAVKLPKQLVEELAKATTLANESWVGARHRNHFKAFLPHLRKIVTLVREKADALGWGGHPYDALLDEYEPDATTEQVRSVFEPLKTELTDLVQRIAGSERRPDARLLEGDFPEDRQRKLCREMAAAIGFDFDAGRLDTTTHPFCTGIGPGDTRLTTRFERENPAPAVFITLHEAGHGIYNQGLDADHWGAPRGQPASLAIHESQSRLWENFVGRSRAFLRFLLPKAREVFPEAFAEADPEALYFAVNASKPSLIRVEADEATYNLHIMLRVELEQALVDGSLNVEDVPEAWNAACKALLGLDVPDDARGCLQDIHWSMGGIGYFPTYALGNLYAAQFFAQARNELGELEGAFGAGKFDTLREWLTKKIHMQGKRYTPMQLCEKITDAPLSHEPLMEHLKGKFGPLYGF